MTRRFLLILIILSVSFGFPVGNFAQTVCKDEAKKECDENKRSLPSDCLCCCTKIKETDKYIEWECKPTDPVTVTNEDGTTEKKCPEGTKKRTATSGKCICKFKQDKE